MSDRPRVIFTAGVWDLLHRGHLDILHRSAALGDLLVVGVITDAGCAAYKGHFPAQNIQQRLRAIERLRCVDVVAEQSGTDPTQLLERFRPDVMTHGDDWAGLKEGSETLARLGIEWVMLPYGPGPSTTEYCRRNGIERRTADLGISGPVFHPPDANWPECPGPVVLAPQHPGLIRRTLARLLNEHGD